MSSRCLCLQCVKCRFCCIFTVWLLSDCYPAVLQSTVLGQVTGLLQRKSNQANPVRSLTILSSAARHRRPPVTHTERATHTLTMNSLSDMEMDTSTITSSPTVNLAQTFSGLSAKRNIEPLPATRAAMQCSWPYILTSQQRLQRWIYPLGINSVSAKIPQTLPPPWQTTL